MVVSKLPLLQPSREQVAMMTSKLLLKPSRKQVAMMTSKLLLKPSREQVAMMTSKLLLLQPSREPATVMVWRAILPGQGAYKIHLAWCHLVVMKNLPMPSLH